MLQGKVEFYRPRAVSDLGLWDIEPLQFKVYGIAAEGKEITDAHAFVSEEVLRLVAAEGEDNGLGFVIIHPGDLGVSIIAHWWIQRAVLCQHICRQRWGAVEPMNTAARPVIACVRELGVINAEQEAWRETTMHSDPNPSAYLKVRTANTFV